MGSEMCIRDRLYIDQGELSAARNEARRARFRVLMLEGILAFNEGCLLYTSDAADERSSVDLGGRRIIKKKKMKAYSGATRDAYIRRQRR